MRFVLITEMETAGCKIRCHKDAPKSPELVSAALAAGFRQDEIQFSPVGVLENADGFLDHPEYKVGGCVLIGSNGATLIELR